MSVKSADWKRRLAHDKGDEDVTKWHSYWYKDARIAMYVRLPDTIDSFLVRLKAQGINPVGMFSLSKVQL